MTRVAMTGAGGFLGWHTRCAALAGGVEASPIGVGDSFDLPSATATLDGADRAIHLAGVNRAKDDDVRDGNIEFATQFASALKRTSTPPPVVVFANSTQATNGSVYGEAKAAAAELLSEAASEVGAAFINLSLPNLFGEHGRPFYNSVTATFSYILSQGEAPTVDTDRELSLLHAQNVADALLGFTDPSELQTMVVPESVSGLLARLRCQADLYHQGDIPDLRTAFDRDLFNTYRSYAFGAHSSFALQRRADARGSFFETVRSHGGPTQSSFSTTRPGVTRGDHFHRRKVERFTVLAGSARISLRRCHTKEVVDVMVSGDEPTFVDMPTMWAHNITNVSSDTLYTSFWANEIFDPQNPDTIAEVV